MRSPYGILVRNRESLAGSRCRREDNIKLDVQEIGYDGVEWIHLAQRFVAILMNFNIPTSGSLRECIIKMYKLLTFIFSCFVYGERSM
jgi:hypothetical protein